MLSSLLVFFSVALAAPVLERKAACSPGVYMIVARGSTEAPGEGHIRSVTSLVKRAISGSSSVGIVYPATLDNYQSSESQGVVAMVQAITDYVTACPDGRIALLGYSQGAQVIGDALGGSAPVNASLTKNCMISFLVSCLTCLVIAAIQFADPAHVAGKSYDVGTSMRDGVCPLSLRFSLLIFPDHSTKRYQSS